MTISKKIRLILLHRAKENGVLFGILLANKATFTSMNDFGSEKEILNELVSNTLDFSWHTILIVDNSQFDGLEFVKQFMNLTSGQRGSFSFVVVSNDAEPADWVSTRKYPHLQISTIDRDKLFTAMCVEIKTP